jgi:hypothetical protein
VGDDGGRTAADGAEGQDTDGPDPRPAPTDPHDAPTDDDATDATDADAAGHVLPDEVEYPVIDHEPGSGLPPRVESWRRRSATGAMLTGFAFGLREVLEAEHREPAIVLETSGVPPKDLPVEADLENLPPRQSVVKIRRWLLTDRPEPVGDDPDGAGSDTPEEGRAATGDAGVAFRADEAEEIAPTGRTTEIRSRKQRPRRFGRREGKRS